MAAAGIAVAVRPPSEWSPAAVDAAQKIDELRTLLAEELTRWTIRSRYECKTVALLKHYYGSAMTLRHFACDLRNPSTFYNAWTYCKLSLRDLEQCFHHSKPDYVARRKRAVALLVHVSSPLFDELKSSGAAGAAAVQRIMMTEDGDGEKSTKKRKMYSSV
jgi:hypothetical protein